MANNNTSKEPSTAPAPDRWYNLTLGSSFKDHQPSSKFCTLRYEFKPASIDKSQPGSLTKNKENRISVEFHNNQHGKPKVTFEGSSEDYKENDAVLFFDGETFRLERLHRAVKRLRHVRLPGESAAASTMAAGTSVGPAGESFSPPVGKSTKQFQYSNKSTFHPMPVEVERIDVADSESVGTKPKNDKVIDPPSSHQKPPTPLQSPDPMTLELEQHLDIMNDDDDVDIDGFETAEKGNNNTNAAAAAEKETIQSGIDINLPQQNDTDDEIADVDVSDDDEADKGRNAAEALRAQVNAQVNSEQRSPSRSRSSSSSSSGSGSASGSESSDDDSVNSI